MANTTTTVGAANSEAPIEPGRMVLLHRLKNRKDLNGMPGKILQALNPNTGRVAVRVFVASCETEDVLIKPTNIEVRWDLPGGSQTSGRVAEVCPICLDTKMETQVGETQNAGIQDCCGKAICTTCFHKLLDGPEPDTCPLCRADTSDTSDEAIVRNTHRRAMRGDAIAQYNLAAYYDQGVRGLEQDQVEARRLYALAAHQGEPRAAANLAISHRDGEGGPVDDVLAVKYFRIAVDLGHVASMTNLGLMHASGRGVPVVDTSEAKRLLKKASRAGDELAAMRLAQLNAFTS